MMQLRTLLFVMKKMTYLSILICSLFLNVTLLLGRTDEHNYVKELSSKLDVANALIEQVIEDWDCFYDVTAETDVYSDWVESLN